MTVDDFSAPHGKDPCPCGSGKKYKRCCDPRRLFTALPKTRSLTEHTLFERNLLLLDCLNDIFDLENTDDISQLKYRLNKNAVLKLYERIAEIFPFGTDFEHLLPQPGQNLRALYLGSTEPRSILNNVARYSLYSDEILLYTPFVNPWVLQPINNPLLRPDVFKQHTLSGLVVMALLAPWIRKGIVHLVPDPGDFDPDLRMKSAKSAELRLSSRTLEPDDLYREEFKAKFSRFVFSAPNEFLIEQLSRFYPDKSSAEINELVRVAKEMNKRDPLALADTSTEQLHMERGGNLEIAAFVAQATNAFPYTNLKFRWNEIKECIKQFPTESEPWTPLTECFQQLEFKFLDNVDPNFAFQLQQDGRLSSFRAFLRRVWKAQESSSSKIIQVRDYCDELKGEYLKAQAEWNKLNSDQIKSGSKLFASIGIGTGSIACGMLHVTLPSGYFAFSAITELLANRLSKRAFKQSVPMSVFVDLARQKSRTKPRGFVESQWGK